MRCWCRVGRWLYLGRAGLLLEDGVVAKALALALLAVSAGGMGFVALFGSRLARGQLVLRGQVRGVDSLAGSLHGGSVKSINRCLCEATPRTSRSRVTTRLPIAGH
jgi:hypothetical protein